MEILPTIETILESMIQTVEDSKGDIFQIQEDAHIQLEKLKENLAVLQIEIEKAIKEQDYLYSVFKQSRQRLLEVSRSFHKYSKKQIEQAYHKANEVQIELYKATGNEERLKKRRVELQEDYTHIEETMKRSEKISLKLSVIMDYLTRDIQLLNDEVQESRQSREFGIRMLQTQEEERKRLSREIHDGPAQTMAHLVAKSDLIEQILLLHTKDAALEEIRELKNDVRSALAEVRRIIYDIRPMALDDLGIIPTLRKYLNNISEKHGIAVDLCVNGKEIRLDPKLEATIFWIVQESVNNVIKHGKTATKISVEVSFEEKLHLQISDDGVGFNTSVKKTDRFGILGMKERVSLFEGELELHSVVNKGTTVLVTFPISIDEK